MGGHSHWANIKHKKGAADVRRGKAWTKCSREITIAAKLGASGDPGSNPRLRKAMEEGYNDFKDVYKDTEFAELRKDKRFTELVATKAMVLPE